MTHAKGTALIFEMPQSPPKGRSKTFYNTQLPVGCPTASRQSFKTTHIANAEDWLCMERSFSKAFIVGEMLYSFIVTELNYTRMLLESFTIGDPKSAQIENQFLNLTSTLNLEKVTGIADQKMPSIPAPCTIAIRERREAPHINRRVSFSTLVLVQTIDLRSEIPKQVFEATWYSRREFRALKRLNAITIVKMTKGIPLDAENEASRGLEHRTPKKSKRRSANRFNSIDAVLHEQERAWEIGETIDPSTLSKVYTQYSAHCLIEAFLMAQIDEKFVLEEESQAEGTEQSKMIPAKRILKPANRAFPASSGKKWCV